jgi:hypothetical protein
MLPLTYSFTLKRPCGRTYRSVLAPIGPAPTAGELDGIRRHIAERLTKETGNRHYWRDVSVAVLP